MFNHFTLFLNSQLNLIAFDKLYLPLAHQLFQYATHKFKCLLAVHYKIQRFNLISLGQRLTYESHAVKI